MKEEGRAQIIDRVDIMEIYENLVLNFIIQPNREKEQEKKVIFDKIEIYSKGKDLIWENPQK